MTNLQPSALLFDRQALTLLRASLVATAPLEGCALVLGHTSAGGVWSVSTIWPALNVWQPRDQRHRRFALDPREQLQAQRWARARNQSVLGAAHSHPASAPVPSACDRRLTLAPALMLIEGRGPAGEPALGCWWLPETEDPQPLAWTMVG
ncbi:MAG: M67 family metallopeptidase [Cyanobacteriota bacterium]